MNFANWKNKNVDDLVAERDATYTAAVAKADELLAVSRINFETKQDAAGRNNVWKKSPGAIKATRSSAAEVEQNKQELKRLYLELKPLFVQLKTLNNRILSHTGERDFKVLGFLQTWQPTFRP